MHRSYIFVIFVFFVVNPVNRYSLAAFDFDGTLVDSEACIRESLGRAIAEHGFGSSTAVLKEWIGLPLHTIIRSACGDVAAARIDEIIAAYRRHYAALDPGLTFAFPGVTETLARLSQAGVRLAIATNKHSTPARATLDRLGITSLFEAIVGAESVARPKPHPDILLRVLELTGVDAADALMVGDAPVDLQMAGAAGVASCAITWGNHDTEQLRGDNPTYLIDSPDDLLRVIFG